MSLASTVAGWRGAVSTSLTRIAARIFLRCEQKARRGDEEEEERDTGSAGLADHLPHSLPGKEITKSGDARPSAL